MTPKESNPLEPVPVAVRSREATQRAVLLPVPEPVAVLSRDTRREVVALPVPEAVAVRG